MLSYASKHSRTDFFVIMESESEIAPAIFAKNLMRTSLPLNLPAAIEQRLKNARRFSGAPSHI